jgi:hypothetical protein
MAVRSIRRAAEAPPAPDDLSPESQRLWPGLVSDVRATWGSGAEQVSEVELILLAGVLRALDRLRMVGAELAKTGPVVEGVAEAGAAASAIAGGGRASERGSEGFERLGVSGWSTRNYASTRRGDSYLVTESPPARGVSRAGYLAA